MSDFIIIINHKEDLFIEDVGKALGKGYKIVSSGQYRQYTSSHNDYWAHLMKGGELEYIVSLIKSIETNLKMR